jgi:hypothetical protein
MFNYDAFVMYGRRGDNPNAKDWEVRGFQGSINRQDLGTIIAQNLTEEEADNLVTKLFEERDKQQENV